jgi:redox-sensitive bicupin YhaK (pirin superfamily)
MVLEPRIGGVFRFHGQNATDTQFKNHPYIPISTILQALTGFIFRNDSLSRRPEL